MAASRVHYLRAAGRGAAPAGFTLIEIMVVVVIIGILAAVLVPQLGGSAEATELEGATRRVADMMDYCYHAAPAQNRVFALLIDTVNRRMDVVAEAPPGTVDEAAAEGAEGDAAAPAAPGAAPTPAPVATPTPAPTPEPTPVDPAAPPAEAGADPGAAADAGPPPPVITPLPDPNAPINLVPVSITGFMDRTLPEGISISSMETYEAGLTEGQNEGQFKILFFPDGTTEFAKIELSTASGRRRQIWLNGLIGSISIIDPERSGDTLLAATITDEDNPDNNPTEEESMEEPADPNALPTPIPAP